MLNPFFYMLIATVFFRGNGIQFLTTRIENIHYTKQFCCNIVALVYICMDEGI